MNGRARPSCRVRALVAIASLLASPALHASAQAVDDRADRLRAGVERLRESMGPVVELHLQRMLECPGLPTGPQGREVARLLDHLEATPAEDGAPLLDHTLVAVVGSIGEPDVHDPLNVPVVLAGAKGWLPHGEHIALDGEPTTNLCSSLLTWMGLPGDPFGLNGTGPVAALARGRP
jgi:hypothetical protein